MKRLVSRATHPLPPFGPADRAGLLRRPARARQGPELPAIASGDRRTLRPEARSRTLAEEPQTFEHDPARRDSRGAARREVSSSSGVRALGAAISRSHPTTGPDFRSRSEIDRTPTVSARRLEEHV